MWDYWKNQQQWGKTHSWQEEGAAFCEEAGKFQRRKRNLKGAAVAAEGLQEMSLLPTTAQLVLLCKGSFST